MNLALKTRGLFFSERTASQTGKCVGEERFAVFAQSVTAVMASAVVTHHGLKHDGLALERPFFQSFCVSGGSDFIHSGLQIFKGFNNKVPETLTLKLNGNRCMAILGRSSS